jgi:hypothetical protein
MTPEHRKKQMEGGLLRKFLNENFSSYKDFARCVGVAPCTVNHWMSGRCHIPCYAVLKLCEIFPDQIKAFQKMCPDMF